MDTRETALGVLEKISGMPRETLTADMQLVGELGIDSVKSLELLVDLEELLGIEITDEQASAIATVGDVLERAKTADGK